MRRGHLAPGDWGHLLRDLWVSRCFPIFGVEILHFPQFFNYLCYWTVHLLPLFSVYLCCYFNFAPTAVLCVSSVCAEHFEGTFSFASIRFFFFIICLQISDLSLSFSLLCFVCCLLCGFLGFKPFPLIFLWFFMVSGSEVWVICPSVSFFFARLGVALGVSGDFLPLVGDFVFAGCGLSVVIGELSPILG